MLCISLLFFPFFLANFYYLFFLAFYLIFLLCTLTSALGDVTTHLWVGPRLLAVAAGDSQDLGDCRQLRGLAFILLTGGDGADELGGAFRLRRRTPGFEFAHFLAFWM